MFADSCRFNLGVVCIDPTLAKCKKCGWNPEVANARKDFGKEHRLKIEPRFFGDVASGIKTFEIRKNDRDFRPGDVLILKEYFSGSYTGRFITARVEYMLENCEKYGLARGYCIMSIKVLGTQDNTAYEK